MNTIDSVERFGELKDLLQRKAALRLYYREVYNKYVQCLARVSVSGVAVELGSGAGFAKEVIPNLVTTDFLAYPGIDRVVDATRMPFENGSVRAFFLHNVFHHIPDVARFLGEAQRCLAPGGRILVIDQNVTLWTRFLFGRLHHEPFAPNAVQWAFASSGPLSGANGALAWIVFKRDHARFEREFSGLRVVRFEPHTPFRYWLAGGLKKWTLLPAPVFGLATALDAWVTRVIPGLCSFVDIEVERV